jgi:quercetin dioxygenase-like cupin family protein
MDELGGGLVTRAGEARAIRESGFNVLVYATSELTNGAFSLIETVEQDPGGGPPLHVHRDAAESFYVIAGAYEMNVNGRVFECPAGSFVYVPRGTAHTFRVTEAASRKLNLYTPSAMEGYFEELSEALRRGVDEAALTEIADRYQMDVLGPAPQSYLERPGGD